MVSAVDVRLLRSSGASIAASMLMILILIVAEAVTVGQTTLSLVIVAAEVAVENK